METARHQARVAVLASELDGATADMKRHLAEYKKLLTVKNSLIKEIETYRRLLEGEGSR